MPKKAPQPPPARRGVVWLGWRLTITVSATLCLLALPRLHRHYLPAVASSASPSISRSSIPRIKFTGDRPKIAFLFLARQDLPLGFLWDRFFEGADLASFSVYIHSSPGFVFNKTTSSSRFFYNRQLKDSIKVEWGQSSMIAAEKLLLAAALEDPANQRFVLLSESCVPLHNFGYIYDYLMASPRSFVDSFLDAKEKRYNERMAPIIPKDKWRKGSQWISLVRNHAEVIADDDAVFPIFEKFCRRRPPYDPSKGSLNIELQKLHNCIPDEHYVQTLLTMRGLENELDRRTLTYTVWNVSATKTDDKAWHPLTFTYTSASPKQIQEIKDINHVNYDKEQRTEWCRTNTTQAPCFLFARKFSRGAAMRLLSQGLVGP